MAKIGTDIEEARRLLVAGEPVAIPTETVYGLAANALDAQAVKRIFAIKKRPSFNPLIVHVDGRDAAVRYIQAIPRMAEKLMDRFWPGPLTLILKKRDIPDIVTAGLTTVAIRCPDHALTLALLERAPFPLAAPSANPFGYVSPTCAEHVNAQLGSRVSYILDGGTSRVGIESTIVGIEDEKAVIYRTGAIDREALQHALGVSMAQAPSASRPVAPGGLKSHYAPKKQMRIGDIEVLAKQYAPGTVGALCFSRAPSTIPSEKTQILSARGDLYEAAGKLFAALRHLDQLDIEVILAEKAPHTGIGVAINDRIQRAATR